MYTTLEVLKQCSACIPGFGRMVRFFGTKSLVKSQKIPLHVIALVGGLNDLIWTIESALIIDEAEFAALRARMLPYVVYYHLAQNRSLRTLASRASDYKLPFSADEAPKKVSKRYRMDPSDEIITPSYKFSTDKEKLARELNTELWFLTGHGKEDRQLGTSEEFEIFVKKINQYPSSFLPSHLSFIQSTQMTTPRVFLAGCINAVSQPMYDIEGRSVYKDENSNTKGIYPGFSSSSDKALLAALMLQPVGTYDFLTEMNYRTPKGIKINPLPGTTKSRVTMDVNTNSLEYLMFIRSTTISFIDTETQDEDKEINYQEFNFSQVDGDTVLVPAAPSTPTSRLGVDEWDEEDDLV